MDRKQLQKDFSNGVTFELGTENAFGAFFTGQSYLASLATEQDLGVMNVTFEPRCRNNWHIHHKRGQILLAVAGEGWYQEAGKPARKLKPGDVENIPAGVKHWHGATKDSYFSHIAIACQAENGCEWLEPVSDEEYESCKEEKI